MALLSRQDFLKWNLAWFLRNRSLVSERNVSFWILQEGYSDGGIVVEDCLKLMLNLLRNNSSNQTFFREGSYIQRISPFFDLALDEEELEVGWAAQKVSNFLFMLSVVRTLVSPSNTTQVKISILISKVVKILKGSLQWKFKFWVGKFTSGNKAKHCWALSANFMYSKVCWQHPAMLCIYNFPSHNLNFHWKWWDQIQVIFLNLFYFTFLLDWII